ncbi:hypothetical protein RQP54_02115 [Curvibacter sp. APW13]|uniref:hypothetical protein n=1 Tax=Curvibacter sp. APW13 TaxID=3077236 RepID=UPI0028DEA4B2|nr:hypothetical protein [Curvibacter sp. APW13]MDT8989653.1 hypothetical protein [Curvibacter sp. APW13]
MSQLDRDEPLGLVVHSLPTPQESVAETPRPSGRLKLLAIMLVCSLPVIASYYAYFVVRPQGKAGFGELIYPARPVESLQATALEGKPMPLAQLKGQWLLVSVQGGACDPTCQQRLFLARQLRASLGQDKKRVDWVWLIPDAAPVDPAMKQPLGDAVVLRVDESVLKAWFEPAAGKSVSDHLFVVDPMGNTMMRLPANFSVADSTKARRDIERLLRASVAWDGPGRP